MGSKNVLGEFLRARRGQVIPEEVGLGPGRRRRVPGLRREELAGLAGVSVDYLVRLEQGRHQRPSDSVVRTLAEALRLNDDDRRHLRDLTRTARRDGSDCGRSRPPQDLRPGTVRLLDALPDSPALVLGRGLHVLGQNDIAVALFGDLRGENLLRRIFLDPRARQVLGDWERTAAEAVGFLRARSSAGAGDRDTCDLGGELLRESADFARLWAAHPVPGRAAGTTRFVHSRLGTVVLDHETLALPDPDQHLVVFTADPEGPDRKALTLLRA